MALVDISFSIVLYNNKEKEISDLLTCLQAIMLKKTITVVDNSDSNELQKVVNSFGNIHYIYSDSNIGYGRAHNLAIESCIDQSKYHVILNPDVTFSADTIMLLYNYMEQNNDVGQIMPKILYEDGNVQKLCKLLPKPSDLIIRRFLMPLGLSFNLDYELNAFKYDSIMEVPSLSGCFMFIRSEILKNIGGFDPRFFLYLEDFDLTRRIHKISKTIFFPNAVVTHGFNKASYNNPKMLKLHIVSAIKYFNKWGWFFDKERDMFNSRTLLLLKKAKA